MRTRRQILSIPLAQLIKLAEGPLKLADSSKPHRPLGIRVLDLTRVIAGQFAGVHTLVRL